MPSFSTLAFFAAASLALTLIPGPAVLYIVTRSISQGRRAGLVSMLGVQAGGLVHVTAAALGLSALLASSATAFSIVKYAGAVYLVWLGIQKLRGEADGNAFSGELPVRSQAHLFRQGLIVNVLNPKTAIFFLAFLPQFIDRDAGSIPLQVTALGLCFVAVAFVSDGVYALLAGSAAERLRGSSAVQRRLDRSSGVIMIGLGAVAALTGHRD